MKCVECNHSTCIDQYRMFIPTKDVSYETNCPFNKCFQYAYKNNCPWDTHVPNLYNYQKSRYAIINVKHN